MGVGVNKTPAIVNDPLPRWLSYLKNGPTEDTNVKVLPGNDHDIRAAHERYLHFTEDEEARQADEDRMKFLRDQANREETAREEGREEGREEQARHIAARLKHSGMNAQQIVDLTGLTVEEVAGL